MKKLFISALGTVLMLGNALAQYTPGQVATQANVNASSLNSFIVMISGVVNRLVPLAVSVAVLAFFWFLIQFIAKGGEDGDARKKSLSGMGFSILALFVMVSVWGLVGFLGSVTGVGQGGSVPIPSVPNVVQ